MADEAEIIISSKVADETELIPEAHWERSVLFQDLPLHTSLKKLNIRFNDKMEDVTFINRRDKVTYTRCGVVRMKTPKEANLILEKSHQDFYGVEVQVERYKGNQHHLELYKQGEYNMEIIGVVGETDRAAHKFLEEAFQQCSFSDVIIHKDNDKKMTGVAEIFFRTIEGATFAKDIAQDLGLEVTCSWEDSSSVDGSSELEVYETDGDGA